MPNSPRWDGLTRRFYEVWYFIFNDPATGDGYWIRYTLLNPLDQHPAAGGTLWFGYTCRNNADFNLAIKRTFPGPDIKLSRGLFNVAIGPACLEEGRFKGDFEAHGHSVEWDLEYEPSLSAHYFFAPWFRVLTESRSSVTIPNPRILLRGRVKIDGTEKIIEQAPGHQAHHWGSQRASRWLWGHCCAFEEDEDAIVEMLSAALPAGINLTFVNLHTRDLRIEAGGVTDLIFNSARAGLGFWSFEAYYANYKLTVDVHVNPRHVLKFVYTSPQYVTSDCWNTQVGDCLVRLYERSGRLGKYRLRQVLKSHGTTAAETHDVTSENIPYPAWWKRSGGRNPD